MPLVLRHIDPHRTVAFSAWLLPNDEVVTVKISQAEYDEFAITRSGVGDAPGRPSPDAQFLVACGGIAALDTVDGWAKAGDCYEREDANDKCLIIAQSDKPSWGYAFSEASEPVNGKSHLRGLEVSHSNNQLRIESGYSIQGQTITLAPKIHERIAKEKPTQHIQRLERLIPNHRSVTFDAKSTAYTTNSATSITWSHTVAAGSNRYIATAASTSHWQDSITSSTYAGTSMSARLSGATWEYSSGFMRDLIAPATGANNIVLQSSGNQLWTCAAWSAQGVDQTTPVDATAKNEGSNSTSPSASLTSTASGLVLSALCWNARGNWSATDTVDSGWTVDDNYIGQDGYAAIASAHKSAGGTVTRTDTLALARDRVLLMVSLKAAITSIPNKIYNINQAVKRGSYW